MSKKKLGASLGELLEDADFAYANEMSFSIKNDSDELKNIELKNLQANVFQPRKNFDEDSINELAQSLDEFGLLQPIVVVKSSEIKALKIPSEQLISEYMIVAGERRFRAALKLGWSEIKAIVAAIEPAKTQELALIENLHRRDLNPIELALAYEAIMKNQGLSQEEFAKRIKKSRALVANTLRLLSLGDKAKELIVSGKLSAGHAKVIAGLKSRQDELCDAVVSKNLSVRECEQLATRMQKNTKKPQLAKSDKSSNKFEKLIKELKKVGLKFEIVNENLKISLKNEKNIEIISKLLGV